MNELIIELKKSAVVADSEFDFKLLTKKSDLLVELTIEKNDDNFIFKYNIENLTPISEMKNISTEEKYRLLLNALKLHEIAEKMHIDLNPDNLFVDYNYNVRVAQRDIYSREDIVSEEKFVNQFASLLGAVLQSKLTYEQLQSSGKDLLNKSKTTQLFANKNTIQGMEDALVEQLNKERDYSSKVLTTVNKKKYKRLSHIMKLFIVVVLLFAGFAGYVKLYQEPFDNAVSKGYEAYVANDYVETIKSLEDVNVNRMGISTKYILSISYIKSESLSEEQKKNILAGITLSTNEKILDFWVYLAQGDVEESIDIAKQLGNKEYTAFGYLKQKEAIQDDRSLSGAEREEKLKAVEQKISEFKQDESTKE